MAQQNIEDSGKVPMVDKHPGRRTNVRSHIVGVIYEVRVVLSECSCIFRYESRLCKETPRDKEAAQYRKPILVAYVIVARRYNGAGDTFLGA